VVRVVVLAMSVQGRVDTQEKLKVVAEIVAVIAIESVGAIVDGELCPVAMRQVTEVTERVSTYRKDTRVSFVI
jgi:hypothetical protein